MRIIDQLVYKITGDSSGFDSAIDKSDKKVNTFSNTIKKLSAGLTIAGAAIIVKKAVSASVDSFSDLETSLKATSTLFGGVNVDMENLQDQTLALSSATGLASNEIGNALYSALSAGIPVTEDMTGAMDFMTKSAQLAKAGFTDIDTAVSTTAKTMNAYGLGLEDVDYINKVLIQTQNLGITTVNELGQSLAQVTPTASAFGVSFDQVGASLASMTAQGTPTAQATTQLNSLIAELGKQGTTASDNLKEASKSAGLTETSFSDLLDSGKNLGEILDLLDTYATDSNLSLVDMFSSIEAGKAGLALSGDNLEKFNDNLEQMTTDADVVGSAYNKVMDSWDEKNKLLKTSIENLGVSMAKNFLPTVGDAIGKVANLIGKLTSQQTESDILKGKVEKLQKAHSDYNDILEDSEGKTDNLTQAMIRQAKQAETLALFELSKEYDTASTEAGKYQSKIDKLNKAMQNEAKASAFYTNALGISLDDLADSELNEQTIKQELIETGKFSNNQIESFISTLKNYKIQQSEVTQAQIDSADALNTMDLFVSDLTQAYIKDSDSVDLLLEKYPDLRSEVEKSAKAYEDSKIITNGTNDLLKEKAILKGKEKDSIKESTEATEENTDAIKGQISTLNDLSEATDYTVTVTKNKWQEYYEQLQEDGENWESTVENMLSAVTSGFGSAFTDMGEALATGEDAWGAFASAGLGALADVVSGLGDQLTAMAVAKLISFDFVNAGLATAGAIGAYTASGALQGVASSYEVGTMDLPYDQVSQLHKGETVLTAGITEEAKTQGITIEPKNKSNDSSGMTQLNIYLGSKLITSEILDTINKGNSGYINKRIVK